MRVVIVTGAGQGIGFEICRQLTLQGDCVLLNDVDASLAETAAAELRAAGGQCIASSGDTAEVTVVRHLVAEAVNRFGRLDLVVANAGITLFGDFFDYEPAAFERVMDVNLRGTFFLVQAAARHMRAQSEGGSIVLMSSVTAQMAHRNLAAYGMTKAAIEMLAKNLVVELSEFGININAVAPGATLTERTLDDPDYQHTWSRITPLGRPASVHDIAAAVLFLGSAAARHITGQTLVVDGGWTSVGVSPY
jgi:glucose 1-dehydrogenase